MAEDENCCVTCLGCLARVPCSTLAAWVFMLASVGLCSAALIIGGHQTRDMLNESDEFLGKLHIYVIAVVFAMLFVCTLFLLVALVSTGRTSKQLFDSSGKNVCARALNISAVVVMILLQAAWTLLSCLLFLPVVGFVLLHVLHKDRGQDCLNLRHYGITKTDKEFCGEALEDLYYFAKKAMLSYGLSFAGAVMTVISMTFFTICAVKNITSLKEGRFSNYNVYRNGVQGNTRASVAFVDTKM